MKSDFTIHSGDLTAKCMRQRMLVRQGKYSPEMPTAMYRGNLFGWTCTGLARSGDYSEDGVIAAFGWAVAKVQTDMRAEGRAFTNGALKNVNDIHAETAQAVMAYAQRIGPMLTACRVIGSELPVYWKLHVDDDRAVDCSSHLDLLLRDVDGVFGYPGRLIFWDYKYTEEAPQADFLARAPQFMLYTLGIRRGQVQLPDDEWVAFNEWPVGAWIHAPYLRPFGRAGRTLDDDGNLMEYSKGDTRPLNKIIRWIEYHPERERDMIAELAIRARMMDADIWPMTPGPLQCQLCDSKDWCPRFDMVPITLETT